MKMRALFHTAHLQAQRRLTNLTCARANTSGQATVEFALTISIFIMLLFGFIGLAIVFFAWLTTVSAAREGARFVISNPSASNSQLQNAICSSSVMLSGSAETCNSKNAYEMVDSDGLEITVEPSNPADRIPNAQISVRVEFRAPVPTLGVTWLNGSRMTFLGPIWVSSQAVMRIDP